MNSKLTRRGFVTAAGAAIVAPAVIPRSVFGANAPSNRITVALIGCGNQSRADLPSMLRQADAQVVAVCDVNRGSDGFDCEMWLGPAPDAPYHIDRCLYRFRFLLKERKAGFNTPSAI